MVGRSGKPPSPEKVARRQEQPLVTVGVPGEPSPPAAHRRDEATEARGARHGKGEGAGHGAGHRERFARECGRIRRQHGVGVQEQQDARRSRHCGARVHLRSAPGRALPPRGRPPSRRPHACDRASRHRRRAPRGRRLRVALATAAPTSCRVVECGDDHRDARVGRERVGGERDLGIGEVLRADRRRAAAPGAPSSVPAPRRCASVRSSTAVGAPGNVREQHRHRLLRALPTQRHQVVAAVFGRAEHHVDAVEPGERVTQVRGGHREGQSLPTTTTRCAPRPKDSPNASRMRSPRSPSPW